MSGVVVKNILFGSSLRQVIVDSLNSVVSLCKGDESNDTSHIFYVHPPSPIFL